MAAIGYLFASQSFSREESADLFVDVFVQRLAMALPFVSPAVAINAYKKIREAWEWCRVSGLGGK